MLTRFDELTCHQAPTTFDHPTQSDPAWTEKLWCNLHDTSGELVLATGFGIYPNRNVLDGFACVNVRGERQHNIRLSRVLRPLIDEISVGPLSYDVQEAYRRIRLRLKPNAQGLSFDVAFLGRMQPGEEEPHFGRSRGRTHVNLCRYAQLGRAEGWVQVGDERFELAAADIYAQRDHSWGIRMGVGLPEPGTQAPDFSAFAAMMINWMVVQFDTWGVQLYYIEGADGRVHRMTGHVLSGIDDDRTPIAVAGYEHNFTYFPGSRRMSGGDVRLDLEDGSSRELAFKELTTMYLRGGGYAGHKGYTHGQYMGEQWVDGEVFDLRSGRLADEVHGLDDTVVEVRCGDEVGYGIVENMILPPFPRYGFTDRP